MSLSPDYIKKKLSGSLPGMISHLKMAPEHRAEELLHARTGDFHPKLSAVMILLFYEEDDLRVVFIRRSEYVGIHSGQIAFPGGRYEESDRDLGVTALRETEEEIGVEAGLIEVLGQLSDLYVPPSNFLVRPVVGFLRKRPVYVVDEREVQEVLEFGFEDFLEEKVIGRKEFPAHNSTGKTGAPCFDMNGIVIWGATAMILTELLDVLFGSPAGTECS